MPYLTPEEILDADFGSRASKVPAKTLETICDLANEGIDNYVGFSLDFRWHGGPDPRTPQERVPFDEGLRIDLTHAPIRTVRSVMLVTSFLHGAPDGESWGPDEVDINGLYGELEASSISFRLGLGSIWLLMRLATITPYWLVEYTSGYDAGDLGNIYAIPPDTPTIVAPDNLCLPYPGWLKAAARFEVARLVGEYFKNRLGLSAGITSTSGGGFAYSAMPHRGTKEENPLDPNARQILDAHLDQQITLDVVF